MELFKERHLYKTYDWVLMAVFFIFVNSFSKKKILTKMLKLKIDSASSTRD